MKRALGLALAAGLGVVLGVPGVASADWHPDSPAPAAVGWTDSAKPGKAFPTGNGLDLPLGTSQDDAGVTHTSRVYATFDLSEYEGAKVTGGTLYVVERSAADCTKRSIEVWRTKALPNLPTWNKAPAELTKLDEIQTPEYCPRANISFDVSSAIADAVAKKQRLVSFVLRVSAEHEADPAYGRELNWYNTVRLSLSHNTVPKVDNAHLYNAGLPCTQLKPYPVVGGFAGTLQALVTDPDEMERLTAEFAIWPVGSPDDRTTYTDNYPQSGRVANANVPRSHLVQGTAYGWQARVSDGTETSAWSKKCFFKYDGIAPSAPAVTSTNHKPDTWGPVGEHPTFVFDGHKDKDIAGFQYSWSGLGVPGTCEGGDYGQLICPDPFDQTGMVKADVPGGKATVTLNPDRTGPAQLTVRSIDLAGNASPATTYSALITRNEPVITLESGPPEWNQEVLLKITPAPGVTGVTEYEIEREGQSYTETRTPDEDGVAYYSFIASEAGGPQLEIRSKTGDFTSAPARWSAYFPPWPGIKSDVYDTTGAQPKGGVGVEGTFTFTPPPGWHEVARYRYTIDADWDTEPTVIEADENNGATVTWTPQTAGYHYLEVSAVKPDGTVSDYSHSVSFQVAD